ncbi:Nicotinamide riboside kinase OS=Saccharomyces cerevisiae (strain ATCC 204508 / S288c) GN=NRK1 PE=1 SV=1 [Rhizoctonia solani AG-1 IB]|uniref:Nicotinamide riboside kinase n=1 Tax=Thanatephorus cucumeris (strain AG1-IB / isolate 7/3/14) TaxID=1108050 RepID=A0A0B7F5H7_THACB|nr:Nicotinamide riboside kinase OS=Saccharomyces cerevisiae (strain ATCC 204508 / S288c) GN=NRK1 PE=1 SV=1 [Rhizoctonia solani AG-1 IB]
MQSRMITIGIGGGSSAGKTTLASLLATVLPKCTVIHQDDYWSDPKECVIHPLYNEPYLEDPATAINWPLFRTRVKALKNISELSDANSEESDSETSSNNDSASQSSSTSNYHLINLCENTVAKWRECFRGLDEDLRSQGIQIKWFIVEGWHLYYDQEVVNELDLRFVIRCSSDVLRARKSKRAYKQKDGTMRVDPPYYWDHFSYPAYIRSHSHLFDGDIDTGPLSSEAESAGIVLLDGEGTQRNLSCSDLFQTAATAIFLAGRSISRNDQALGSVD